MIFARRGQTDVIGVIVVLVVLIFMIYLLVNASAVYAKRGKV